MHFDQLKRRAFITLLSAAAASRGARAAARAAGNRVSQRRIAGRVCA